MTHSISSWAFDDQPDASPPRILDDRARGVAFRARLERRVTDGLKREHDLTTAPDEVLKRTINGRVVVQRRGGR